MNKKEDLRIIKTKASLYRALIDIMKKKSFEDIRVSEICKKSQINRSTFYDHFNDKNELLYSMIQDMKNELQENLVIDEKHDSIKDVSMQILKALLLYIDKNKKIYSSIIKINGNSIAKDMIVDTLIDTVTKEIDKNFNNNTIIPTRTMVLFYANGVISIISEALEDPSKYNPDELYEFIDNLISRNNIKRK
ncbi:MAG: TetR/AcrR family transcriptional regulator C-terminal domain-containing protein [Bacilli bacterium]|nr:TetR/AcrR family transcriptional regulator C-terminal domain-containing protein [Bacilli bacterium]